MPLRAKTPNRLAAFVTDAAFVNDAESQAFARGFAVLQFLRAIERAFGKDNIERKVARNPS